MNGRQLRNALARDQVTKRYFLGVYPSDRLPYKIDYGPRLLIANTDPHYMRGQHWIAMYIPRQGPIEFFDSFGHTPEHYNINFVRFLQRMDRGIKYNDKILQAKDSVMCGPYCLFYALHRCRGIPMDKIISQFGQNRQYNDAKVFQFIRRYCRL